MLGKKILGQLFLAAGLSSVSIAEEEPSIRSEEPQHELRASDEILKELSPYSDILLSLAGKDILALSREDIYSRAEILNFRVFSNLAIPLSSISDRKDAMERVSGYLSQHKDFLISSEITGKMGILRPFFKPYIDRFINDFATNALASAVMASSPSALKIPFSGACVIVTPEADLSPSSLINSLAGFPPSMSGMVRTDAKPENIYKLIMMHEARHCAQESNNHTDPIDRSILTLDKELDADKHAIARLLEEGTDPSEIEATIRDFQLARSIATLRNGGNIFDAPGDYLSHGAMPVAAIKNSFGKNIESADIILSSKIVNFAISTAMAYQTLTFMDVLPASQAIDTKYNIQKLSTRFPFQEIIFRAETIRENEPLVEYAFIKALYGTMSQTDMFQDLNENYSFAGLPLAIIEDYLNAFETLVPDAQTHPVVQAQMELTASYFAPLLERTIETPDFENAAEAEAPPMDGCLPSTEAFNTDTANSKILLEGLLEMTDCLIKEHLEHQIELYKLEQEFESKYNSPAP